MKINLTGANKITIFGNTKNFQEVKGVIRSHFIFFILILCNCFFMLISSSSLLQFAIFTVNLLIVATLLGWRMAIFSIFVGFLVLVSIRMIRKMKVWNRRKKLFAMMFACVVIMIGPVLIIITTKYFGKSGVGDPNLKNFIDTL